jgi:hypothetical protein
LVQEVLEVVVHTVLAEMLEAIQVLVLLNQQVVAVAQRLGTPTAVQVVMVVVVQVLMSLHQPLVAQEIHLQLHPLKEIMVVVVLTVVVTNTLAVVEAVLVQLVELQQLQLLVMVE